jgi:hypothetical protein
LEIYSEAYSQDPAFYEFWRTLESYETTFSEGESTILLSPNSQYMQILRDGGLLNEDDGIEEEGAGSENTNSTNNSETN